MGFLGTGFVTLGLAVFFKPIATDLNLGRAVMSITASAQSIGNGIWGPIAGKAGDKYGPRVVMMIGVVCLSLGLMAMYFVNSLWSLIIVWGLFVGTGFALSSTIITDRAIVNWFVKKSGIALNTKFALQSFSGLAILPLIAWLIETQGWRVAFLISGAIIAVIGPPVIWFLIKPHLAEYYGLLPDGVVNTVKTPNTDKLNNSDPSSMEGFTLKQTIHTPSFWMIISLGYVGGLAMPVMSVHCVNFLTDMNIAPVQAASMMGLITVASIPARLITGFLVDRIKTNRLRFMMTIGYVVQTLGIGLLVFSNNIGTVYLGIIMYGIGQGTSFSVQLPMWARYFGRKEFGAILGIWTMVNIPIGIISPIYVGWMYDTTGSYDFVFTLMAILLAVSTVMTCFLFPPKQPAPTVNIGKTDFT
jgi:MFS family permease